MMESRIWVLIAGLAIGGLGVLALTRPEPPEAPEERFIVVQNQDAYAIFEVTENDITEAHTGNVPDLATNWGLIRDYQPTVLTIGGQDILYVPRVKFSADEKDFSVTPEFFRYVEDKLMEIDIKPIPGD